MTARVELSLAAQPNGLRVAEVEQLHGRRPRDCEGGGAVPRRVGLLPRLVEDRERLRRLAGGGEMEAVVAGRMAAEAVVVQAAGDVDGPLGGLEPFGGADGPCGGVGLPEVDVP